MVEAGAVVGPDPLDAPLDGGRTEYGGIHRQVAALGVSPQAQLSPRQLLCRLPDILHRHGLSRDLGHASHVQIFLPTGQGIVRPPEGHVQPPIPCVHRQGGELLRPVIIQPVGKAVQLHVPEPGTRGHFPQHQRDVRRHQHAHVDTLRLAVALEKRLRRPVQRHAALLSRRGHDAAEIQKGKLRQDQIVHLVERSLRQRQVSPPIQIIQKICHIRLLV